MGDTCQGSRKQGLEGGTYVPLLSLAEPSSHTAAPYSGFPYLQVSQGQQQQQQEIRDKCYPLQACSLSGTLVFHAGPEAPARPHPHLPRDQEAVCYTPFKKSWTHLCADLFTFNYNRLIFFCFFMFFSYFFILPQSSVCTLPTITLLFNIINSIIHCV